MIRKMVFIFFSIMSSFPNDQKTAILLLFSGIFLYATMKFSPFVLRKINLLEFQSNLTAMITIFAGALYILDVGDFLKIIAFCLIVVFNSVFAVKWLLSFWDIAFSIYKTKILKLCSCLMRILHIFRKPVAETRILYQNKQQRILIS